MVILPYQRVRLGDSDGEEWEGAEAPLQACLFAQVLNISVKLVLTSTRVVPKSEQIEARARRAPEVYAVVQ